MNWKRDLKLTDLEPDTELEVTCKTCGLTRYDKQRALLKDGMLKYANLNEVEAHLKCASRFCRGAVRIALVHDDKNEGFVGGMA